MIERKLFSVQEELTRANENIIRLQEEIKAMQKENESVHAMQNFDIDDLKADNKIFWNVLISDPVKKPRRRNNINRLMLISLIKKINYSII